MSLDAFGRLRVSNTFTLFSYYPNPLTGNSNIDEDILVQTKSTLNSTISYNF